MVSYDASVADGRGGGAHGRNFVTVAPAPASGSPPSGGFTVSPTDAPAGATISVTFNFSDPDGGPVLSDFWIGQRNGASGGCCYGPGTTTVRLDSPGAFRFSSQAIDRELNLSTRPSTVVRIGGATGEPPIASATQDRASGPVPLTVNFDMRSSSDPDGQIVYYFFDCGGGSWTGGTQNPRGSCTYQTPGTYWILLQVQDNAGNFDVASAYAVATPVATGLDLEAPTVSLQSPASGSHVSGDVAVSAFASDNVAVTQATFFLDSGIPLGSVTAAPWAIMWDSGNVSPGAHGLYVVARDAAGNVGTSSTIPITVDALLLPQVTITSPTNGATIPRRSTLAIQLSVVAGSYPTARVDFLVDSTVICSDAAAPYSCNWTVGAKPNRAYQVRANAYDTKGRVGSSNTVTVTAR